MNATVEIRLRRLGAEDLAEANRVIEAAIMIWDLPARVKRLAMPTYRYHEHDLDHLTLVGATTADGVIVGVVAWEPAAPRDVPDEGHGLLLHGIYVSPDRLGTGIGSRLLDAAIDAARAGGFDGLLAKAVPSAQGFFSARGLQRVPAKLPENDYPYRFWKDVTFDRRYDRAPGTPGQYAVTHDLSATASSNR